RKFLHFGIFQLVRDFTVADGLSVIHGDVIEQAPGRLNRAMRACRSGHCDCDRQESDQLDRKST
ncbi:MAG: hypothetical protein VX218_15420, partial [Pseudomonadota bacterium]|nr:hypothetical protein [Pseudomonadota bacterium]